MTTAGSSPPPEPDRIEDARETRIEPIRSRFDTTLGIVFFNVPRATIPQASELLVAAKARRHDSPESRLEYMELIMAWVAVRHYPLMAHEWGHALQAVSHPGLYLRCLREFSAMCTAIDLLKKDPNSVQVPFVPSEPWGTDLVWPTYPIRIAISEEGIPRVEESDEKWPTAADLSETDLLEDSASIFQYKAEIGGDGSVDGYRHWLEEKGERYPRAFKFISKRLSPADAYVALPALVMAAHMTNWPVHGFASLLAMTMREAPAAPSEMGIDLYWAYLESALEESFPTGACPDPRRHLHEEGEHRRIDRAGMLELAQQFPMHPLSPVIELAWGDKENVRRLWDAILHPALALNRRNRGPEDWIEPYSPPATAFRVLDEIEVSEMPLMVSPTLVNRDPPAPDMPWPEYLIELMRMKAFVFSAATPLLRTLPHNCPHVECEYHRYDMCRGWIHIPKEFRECNFPDWLRKSANRRFDFTAGLLEPAGDHKEQG